MGTVSKALRLLDFMIDPSARLGLTEISRLAGLDKATTRRLLLELLANGFVEQDSARSYALGPALQMLGRAREDRFPIHQTLQAVVRDLAERTDESVHACEFSAGQLLSICTQESSKAIRVSLNPGQKLPLHATASGIAFLAACKPAALAPLLRAPRASFTDWTPVAEPDLMAAVDAVRARGYSVCLQTMEVGMLSIGSAILGPSGAPIGALAIAMPIARASDQTTAAFGEMACAAARTASERLFGGNRSTS